MKRFIASIGVALAVLACTISGCGSSRDGFDDPNGLGGPAGSNGNGIGSGQPGTLNCKGLTDGTKSSAGCDYYAVVPDVLLSGNGACFAVFIANTWSEPILIGVEYDGKALPTQSFSFIPSGTGAATKYKPLEGGAIPPGEVAILFLNRAAGGLPMPGLNFDCPAGITPAIKGVDAAVHGTNMGKAFHITTTAAVAAYDIYPYGGGQSALTSATLLLPTTSWDTNYIAVDAYGDGLGSGGVVQIVGQADGTQVTISPANDIVAANGVPGAKKGTPTTYTINKGQVLQFTQDASLAGSAILSTAPVGVWGGKTGLAIDACCNDSAHQQIPPVRALGSEYVGVRYRNRYDGIEETPPWRVIGAVDGTTLTWEPSPPSGAPMTLNQGQVAEFRSPGGFVVRSQDDAHPFYMAQYMTGAAQWDPEQTSGGKADGRGDAEFVNVVPPAEYPSDYVFFTDPTYPETNLVLVRTKVDGAFADVNLDCAGNLTGWQPLGTSGNFEFTRIDLVRHDFQKMNGCDNGRHEIHSKNPFGLTVWGWGSAATGVFGVGFYSQYVSYAYPGGANVKPINNVVVKPVVR
ncbi:MAG: IgGFc-binding protein [Labilithrix sp.]|nr:IgGFc-binding protein [Labilithrix sp.]